MDVGAPCGNFTALAVVNKQSLREKSPVNIKHCKTNKGPDKVLNLSLPAGKFKADNSQCSEVLLTLEPCCGTVCFFSPWQPRLNDCKLPLLHCS